jgi:hypothetical protein
MDKITLKEALEFKTQMAEHFDNRGRVILLDNGELRLAVRHRAKGTLVDEHNHVHIAFDLGRAHGTATDIKNFVNSAPLRDLLATVHAGHEVEWDGHNHAGVLTEEAQAAYVKTHNEFNEHIVQAAEKDFGKSKGRRR